VARLTHIPVYHITFFLGLQGLFEIFFKKLLQIFEKIVRKIVTFHQKMGKIRLQTIDKTGRGWYHDYKRQGG
jgi:hypothetical protein